MEINTKPNTFDYLTDPINARLHDGLNRTNLPRWGVKYPAASYQRFNAGDGSSFLQLKQENGALTIGFFQAIAHKLYFQSQINYAMAVTTH